MLRNVLRNNLGINLVEAMIAAAMVAGTALVVASYITTSQEQSKSIGSSQECESRLSSVATEIKAKNNNRDVLSWWPNPNSLDPTELYSSLAYMNLNILDVVPQNPDVAYTGASVVFTDALSPRYAVGNTFTEVRREDNIAIASNANNYQLVRSGMNIVSRYYPALCNDFDVIPDNSNGDILERLAAQAIEGLENAELRGLVQIETPSGIQPCTTAANLRILSGNPLAYVNEDPSVQLGNDHSFRLGLELRYDDMQGDRRSCRTSVNLSPGRIAIPPPPLQIGWEVVSTTQLVSGIYLCGDPGNRPSARYTVNGINYGSQVLCRLDFAENSSGVENFSSSGWFICGLGTTLNGAVAAVTIRDIIRPESFSFTISNLNEGFYRLHVMEIDVARNATITSSVQGNRLFDFGVDLTRPGTAEPIRPAIIRPTLEHNPALLADPKWAGVGASFPDTELFQCGPTPPQPPVAPAWTAMAVEAGIAVTPTSVGVQSGINGSVPDPSCGDSFNDVVSQDGTYQVKAIACDGCGSGGIGQRTWVADLNDDSSPVISPSATQNRSGPLSFNVGSSAINGPYAANGGGGILPTAISCPMFSGTGAAAYSTQRVDGSGGSTTCNTGAWSELFSGCRASPDGGFCYESVDGCGRRQRSPSRAFTVHGIANDVCRSVNCAPGHVCDHIGFGAGFCKLAGSEVWSSGPGLCVSDADCVNDTQASTCGGVTAFCFTGGNEPDACPAGYEQATGAATVNSACGSVGPGCTRSRRCRKTEAPGIGTISNLNAIGGACALFPGGEGTCSSPTVAASGAAPADPFCPIFPTCDNSPPPPPPTPLPCLDTPTCEAGEVSHATVAACNLAFGTCREVTTCTGYPEQASVYCGSGCLANELVSPSLIQCNADDSFDNCTDRNGVICGRLVSTCVAPEEACLPPAAGFDSCTEVTPGIFCGEPSCPLGTVEGPGAGLINCQPFGAKTCCETDDLLCPPQLTLGAPTPYYWQYSAWSSDYDTCTAPPISCGPGEREVFTDQGPISRTESCRAADSSPWGEESCCVEAAGPPDVNRDCNQLVTCEPAGASCDAIPPSLSIRFGLPPGEEGMVWIAPFTDVCCLARDDTGPGTGCYEHEPGTFECMPSGNWALRSCYNGCFDNFIQYPGSCR